MPEENTPEGTGKRIGKEILSFVLFFVIVIAAMLLIIFIWENDNIISLCIMKTIGKLIHNQILEEIARVRGCLMKGNQMDIDKAGRLLLEDFRSLRLGKLSLEVPDEQ